MVFIGVLCNVLTIIVTIFSRDAILFGFTFALCVISIVGYCISNYTKTNFGVHLMLMSYLIVFTSASFTHLVSYPLVLVYPIVFGFAILTLKTNQVRIFYAVLCTIACLIFIYLQQKNAFESSYLDMFSSIIIGIGLLFAFFTLSIFHLNLLRKYEDELIEIKDGLEEKNEELERYIDSNMQLENFAHLASHELKTPIKNIANFSGLLKLKLKNTLANEENEIIDYINKEVNNMNNLITDLLDLSQATNEKLSFTKFSSSYFFKKIINQYFKNHQQNIFLNTMPDKIMAHEKLLQQVFINLIGNAIKFRDKNKELSIRISVSEDDKNFQFSINDNGIGIDKDAQDKIFLIFKRLHSGAEFEGTGIGLAISKKIVERHGGIISVLTNEEGGTCFSFNFDKAYMIASTNKQAAKLLQLRS